MSYFGDHTPNQEMLEAAEAIQRDFKLSKEQLIVVLLNVATSIADPYGTQSDEIRTHHAE